MPHKWFNPVTSEIAMTSPFLRHRVVSERRDWKLILLYLGNARLPPAIRRRGGMCGL